MTHPPPEGFRHRVAIPVRFGDLDAMGHVNNAMYLTYMETGRVSYFRDLNLWDGTMPRQIGPIMAKATIDYKLPVSLEDGTVDVFTRCIRLGYKSYEVEHQIVRYRGDEPELAALGFIVLVAYDYRIGQSVPLLEAWRERILAYEPQLPILKP